MVYKRRIFTKELKTSDIGSEILATVSELVEALC